LFRRGVSAKSLEETPPAAITPPGLDTARQLYLYNNIRQFVPDHNKDVLCPPPAEVELQPSEPAAGPSRATSCRGRQPRNSKHARGKRGRL